MLKYKLLSPLNDDQPPPDPNPEPEDRNLSIINNFCVWWRSENTEIIDEL